MNTHENFEELLAFLNEANVQYVIVGAAPLPSTTISSPRRPQDIADAAELEGQGGRQEE